jgi:PAS domain S-box-containing protein
VSAEASASTASEALRTSERRYQSLVERVPGIVYLNEVDPADPKDIRCVYVGPQVEDVFGCTPEEWKADPGLWQRFVHPDDLAFTLEQNDLAETTGALGVEYRVVRRDGTTRWVHDEAVLIHADGKRPGYWQGVMVDITAQRVQDQALRELTESIRGIFTASPLALIVLEPDKRTIGTPPPSASSAGRRRGRRASHLPVHHRRTEPTDHRRALAARHRRLQSVRLRKDGTPVEVSISTAALAGPDGSVSGILGVLEDVTEKRAAEQVLESRRQQQAAVAGLGVAALEGVDLGGLLDEAAGRVAETLKVPMASVLDFRGRADVALRWRGWHEGLWIGRSSATPRARPRPEDREPLGGRFGSTGGSIRDPRRARR